MKAGYTSGMSWRAGVLVLPFLLVAFAFVTERAKAQATCTAPLVAVGSDREIATYAGVPASATCWNPDDQFSGREIGTIKKWLDDHSTGRARGRARCLNPEFARKLKPFMEAAGGASGGRIPIITDSYRTTDEQQRIIDRGDGATRVRTACGSHHPWGAAADFNNNTPQQTATMRSLASQAGLAILGNWDPNHFQLPTRSGQCGACEAAGTSNRVAPRPPTTGVANAFRGALGLQTNPPPPLTQPPPPRQPPLPPQPLTPGSSGGIMDSFQPTNSLIPQSGGPSLPSGVSGQIGASFNSNTNVNTNAGSSSALSVADRLREIAFGTGAATSTRMATSAPLVITGDQAGTLAYTGGQQPQQPSAGSIGTIQPTGQQTFTSGDLRFQPEQPTTYSGSTYSQLVTLYTALRDTLATILEYLRPFGPRAPAAPVDDQYYLE